MVYKLVVDSSSDIPSDLASRLGIVTVPMPVYIDGNTYHEGVDIFPENFYENFHKYKELPKTSQPNPNTLLDTYEKILAEGYDVVAIHLSSGLSSTYQTACIAKEICSSPERVHVVDSLGASFGFGLLAVLAKDIIDSYSSWEDIEPRLLDIRNNMRYIFTIDILEYLVKGGRISKTAGFVAGLLNVKPILHMTEQGKIEVFSKVRSRKAAVRKLVDIMEQEIHEPEKQLIGISHSDCFEDAKILAEEIWKRLKVKDIIISKIGCLIGSHVGPGTVALFYQSKKTN